MVERGIRSDRRPVRTAARKPASGRAAARRVRRARRRGRMPPRRAVRRRSRVAPPRPRAPSAIQVARAAALRRRRRRPRIARSAHGGDAVAHLVGAVGGDLLEAVHDRAVREACDAARRGTARARRPPGAPVRPRPWKRRRASAAPGRRSRRRPSRGRQEAGVGEDRVRAVEQPQLAELPRLDVVDEPGPGALPVGSPRREVAREHPVAERLGHDRCRVDPAVGPHGGDVGATRARRDAVDRGADERHGAVDPARAAAAPNRLGDAPDAPAHALAVLRACCRTTRRRSAAPPARRRASSATTRRMSAVRGRAPHRRPEAARPRRRTPRSAATAGSSRSAVPSWPQAVAGLGDVSVTTATASSASSCSRRPTSAPSYAATMLVTTSTRSPSAPRSTSEIEPVLRREQRRAALRIATGEGRDAPARRHPCTGGVPAWWARWKAPRPRCTMRIGAGARPGAARAARERRSRATAERAVESRHSLNTSRGMASTRSRAMRWAVRQADASLGDEPREEAGVDAARHVVAGGDREERPGVVDEPARPR